MKKFSNILFSLAALAFIAACTKDDTSSQKGGEIPLIIEGAEITFEPQSTHTISSQLIGFNTIYSHFDDAFWATSAIKTALPNMKSTFLRYPGGAPTNRYHWNNLNGYGWQDNWDPAYNEPIINASEYTDVDEYLAICAETGATPLIGINLGSGLKYDRVSEGIAEAVALVEKCKAVATHFYLDNEPYHEGANRQMTAAEYIEQIKLYVAEIDKVHPDAKYFINWEKLRRNTMWTIIEAVHDIVDYVDVHWYWRNSEATFADWREQHPMLSQNKWYEEGESYESEIEWFKAQCESKGYDIKLSSLEWNVGKVDETSTEVIQKYEASLIQSEMLMQFMNGGLDVAVMWPIFFDGDANDPNANRYLMDMNNGYELSPSYAMFSLLSEAMGKQRHKSQSSHKAVYSLVVGDNLTQEKIIYAHSKNSKELQLKIDSEEYTDVHLEIFTPTDDTLANGGVIGIAGEAKYDNGYYVFNIPAYSVAKLELKQIKQE